MLARQRNACSICGDTLGSDTVYEHRVALHQMTQEQTVDDYQGLCGQCSADKTTAEPRASVGILRSRFSRRVWEAYVESEPTPCMAYKDEGIGEFDVRSRKTVICAPGCGHRPQQALSVVLCTVLTHFHPHG